MITLTQQNGLWVLKWKNNYLKHVDLRGALRTLALLLE